MANAARDLISDLGGYRAVARRLGKTPQTVHGAMQDGVFPAAWFAAFCALCAERDLEAPSIALFSMAPVLPPAPAELAEAS